MDEDNFESGGSGQYGDSSIVLPDFTKWKQRSLYDYESHVTDYEDFAKLDSAMTACRRASFLVTDKINEFDRKAAAAKTAYDRAFRREFLSSTEKSSEARKMRAALKCEELENEWLKLHQLKEELVRSSFALKSELNTLQTIAHNLRQQLKM